MCSMRRVISPEQAERLSKLPDVDLTNLSVPDCVLRVKDLSNYPTDRDGAVDHNTYFVWYKDGTGEGVSCSKEQLSQWFSGLREGKGKQEEDL